VKKPDPLVAELAECVELLLFARHDPDWPDCADRAAAAVRKATGRPPRKPRPEMVRRQDVIDVLSGLTVSLGGFALADRVHFAAFNVGRFQQAAIDAVEKLKGA
jgi:predicted RNA-binding protein with EMAP domain